MVAETCTTNDSVVDSTVLPDPLKKLPSNPGCVTYNLGTGIGYSVLDMLKAFY